jgi:hypothetical protein
MPLSFQNGKARLQIAGLSLVSSAILAAGEK